MTCREGDGGERGGKEAVRTWEGDREKGEKERKEETEGGCRGQKERTIVKMERRRKREEMWRRMERREKEKMAVEKREKGKTRKREKYGGRK